MGSKDYGVVCAVYILTAVILAAAAKGIAYFCFPGNDKGDLSVKAIVAKRMSRVPGLIYKGTLASFVQEDGSPIGFVDYFCDKKELFGLIDWRKKTAAVRPRWTRVCAILTTLMVTISLAFLLGTVVYNNENCVSTQTVNYCNICSCSTYCNGVNIGCTSDCQCKDNYRCGGSYSCSGSSSEVSSNVKTSTETKCESASVETSEKANWVTMFLTMVMAKAGSVAIDSADDGSVRQKFLLMATACTSVVLIIFGVLYSQSLAKEENEADPGASERRLKSIGSTLLAGWWYEQLVGFGAIISQFLLYWACWYWLYQPLLVEAKSAGATAVYPHDGLGLDDKIMKTEAVQGGLNKPVDIKEITLQPPTQQQ